MRRAAALALVTGLWLAGWPLARAQSPPLPDRETFFAEVRKNLAANDRVQIRFSFRERTTEINLNPVGRMGTGPILVHEVYPQPDQELTYRRLIERDGRRLSAAELSSQDRKYLARLRQWRASLRDEGQDEREERLKKEAEMRERDQKQSREALELFDFRIEHRDTFEGQPAIIVSFTPKPSGRPRTREGRVAYGFAGRAWIHEPDREVMHVEARAIDDVSFGFGMIARLHDGSTAQFTRRRIDGVWLPVETRFRGTGRALLLRKVVFDYQRTYYGYRPYDPVDVEQLLAGKPATGG
jgi:hypothetical protein